MANLVRGKSVAEARTTLKFLAKRAGSPLEKLIQSAAANAVKMGREEGSLFIKELRVDKGIVMKRMMPAAMGAAHRINKRTSHITLVLGEKETGNKVEKPKKSAVKKEKKPAAKAAVK